MKTYAPCIVAVVWLLVVIVFDTDSTADLFFGLLLASSVALHFHEQLRKMVNGR